MRKYFSIIFVIFVFISLCSCSDTDAREEKQPEEFVINMPTDDSLNGYKSESSRTSSNSEVTTSNDDLFLLYYANTKSKKFHKNTCRYAKITSNDNLYITESREELVNEGYVPCKVCEP